MINFQKIYPNFPFSLPMLLDGATGTAMIRAGMPAGVCPELWILEHPDAIRTTQNAYFEAGSDAVLTPTFGANRVTLERYLPKPPIAEINQSLAALSREVAGAHHLIGGDLSPTGKFLSPIGDATVSSMIEDYKEQVEALSPIVDFFMVETFMDLAASRAAVMAAKAFSDKPVFVTLTVTASGKTMSGDDPRAALLTLAELGIAAFGFNCSTGPTEMIPWLTALVPLSRALGIPLIAKPNAGPPTADGAHMALPTECFAEDAGKLLAAGVGILGGCCGTDAHHIHALREVIDGFSGEPEEMPPLDLSRLACTNRMVMEIPEALPAPLTADEDFAECATEMAEEEGFAFVRLCHEEDVQTVLDAAPFCPFPLAICGETSLLTRFCREYCGKPFLVF